jgi:hypothetical protein
MKSLEETKQEIREYIEKYVDKHASKENLVNEVEDLKMFYMKKSIELLGLDYVVTMLNGEIWEKYKNADRQLTANMTALANLIYKDSRLEDLL